MKKESDNSDINSLNLKEKNIITVDLTNDEKIVFSQLGINPLLKLGKEYLTSNNFPRLKESKNGKEHTSDNKKTTAKHDKKILKSKEDKNIEINVKESVNLKDKSAKNPNENEEVIFLDKKDETELPDEIKNARKKRRRSSANIE